MSIRRILNAEIEGRRASLQDEDTAGERRLQAIATPHPPKKMHKPHMLDIIFFGSRPKKFLSKLYLLFFNCPFHF